MAGKNTCSDSGVLIVKSEGINSLGNGKWRSAGWSATSCNFYRKISERCKNIEIYKNRKILRKFNIKIKEIKTKKKK